MALPTAVLQLTGTYGMKSKIGREAKPCNRKPKKSKESMCALITMDGLVAQSKDLNLLAEQQAVKHAWVWIGIFAEAVCLLKLSKCQILQAPRSFRQICTLSRVRREKGA